MTEPTDEERDAINDKLAALLGTKHRWVEDGPGGHYCERCGSWCLGELEDDGNCRPLYADSLPLAINAAVEAGLVDQLMIRKGNGFWSATHWPFYEAASTLPMAICKLVIQKLGEKP